LEGKLIMLSKNHPIILFIDRFGFSVYQDGLNGIAKFNFTPDLVSDLDVVDRKRFVSLIETFIQINKITGSSLAVILSDSVIYVKNLSDCSEKSDLNGSVEHKDEIQDFLENVPFEEVLAKIIKTENANRVIAVNKDLVMTIVNTFISKGSTIETMVPSFMYGQCANFAAGLTSDSALAILKNAEILKSGNLLTDQEKIVSPNDSENKPKKPRHTGQYLLVAVLAILLTVLVVVYLNMNSKIVPIKREITPAKTVNAPTAIPTIMQTVITVIPVDIKSVKVRITQGSQDNEKAVSLKSGLLEIGLQDVVSEISEVSVPEKSSVIFAKNIPVDLRNSIITEIKEILPNLSISESQNSDFTVNISIGKS
jgi:hypothetical protein